MKTRYFVDEVGADRRQLARRRTGKAMGRQFTIAARDHSYPAFKSYADGSAAYPAAGSTSSSIMIARVLPLSG